jgi:hypothetical protein
MESTEKNPKGYNERKAAQPQSSAIPDTNVEKSTFPPGTSPNEKLSIPERKVKKGKK